MTHYKILCNTRHIKRVNHFTKQKPVLRLLVPPNPATSPNCVPSRACSSHAVRRAPVAESPKNCCVVVEERTMARSGSDEKKEYWESGNENIASNGERMPFALVGVHLPGAEVAQCHGQGQPDQHLQYATATRLLSVHIIDRGLPAAL